MDKEEIALQLTLKAIEKFRLEKANQVAEIFNIIFESLRIPARSSEQNQVQTAELEPANQPVPEPERARSSQHVERQTPQAAAQPTERVKTRAPKKGGERDTRTEQPDSQQLLRQLCEALIQPEGIEA
jgi:hypothetical protein